MIAHDRWTTTARWAWLLLLASSAVAADLPGLGVRFEANDVFVAQGQSVLVQAHVSNLTTQTLELVGAAVDANSPLVGPGSFDAFLAAAPAQLGPFEAWDGGVLGLSAAANADTGTTVLGVRLVASDPLDATSSFGMAWLRVHVTPPGCLPAIALQPSGTAARTGAAVTLAVQAGSPSPLAYRWRRDGSELSDGGEFAGTTTSRLAIASMSAALNGIYDCRVTNDCGAVTSAGARMTTCTAPPFSVRADFSTPAGAAVLVRRNTEPIAHLLVSDGSGSILDFAPNGAGAFQPPTPIAAVPGTSQLLTGDLNGDGIPDVLSVSPADHSYSVFLSAPTGGFQPRVDAAISAQPGLVALGDLNGDGVLDLVISFPATYTMQIHLGTGNGLFTQGPGLDASPPADFHIEDLDHDGYGDLVIAENATKLIWVYRSNGHLGFGSPIRLTTLAGPLALAMADLDGDGHTDLIVTQAGAHMVSLFRGGPGLTFEGREDIAVVEQPVAPRLADLDGDGALDLLVADHASSSLVLFTGYGEAGFSAGEPLAVGEGPSLALSTDTDGDGLADLVAIHDTPAGTTLLYQRCDSPATTDVGAGAAPRLLALTVGPNPFHDATQMALTLPRASQLELGVYDASGRLVRRLHQGAMAPGNWHFAWDGHDARDVRVNAGVYFVRARVDGSVLRSKLVVVR